jgi:NAD(P)H-hydrate epimerase
MSGAIALAGIAALRSGAGLVTLAVPQPCLATVAAFEPSMMTLPLPADEAGRIHLTARDRLSELADAATALACGPGLGRSAHLNDLTTWMYEGSPRPIVFDADALFALAQDSTRLPAPGGARVLTPHIGEFRRLIHNAKASREELEEAAVRQAKDWGVCLVLKGHRTLITDGEQLFRNTTGNPGMATGGSGDVLTGIITALVCQGMSTWEAARLGVHVHGLAGDIAAAQLGQVSLIASDLIRHLPDAFQKLTPNDAPSEQRLP